jgi:hypothetical protein
MLCSVCKQDKAESEFYRRKRARRGHAADCKSCQSALKKKLRAVSRDDINAEKRKMYREDRDIHLKRSAS